MFALASLESFTQVLDLGLQVFVLQYQGVESIHHLVRLFEGRKFLACFGEEVEDVGVVRLQESLG